VKTPVFTLQGSVDRLCKKEKCSFFYQFCLYFLIECLSFAGAPSRAAQHFDFLGQNRLVFYDSSSGWTLSRIGENQEKLRADYLTTAHLKRGDNGKPTDVF
jgi:hypothetical protein